MFCGRCCVTALRSRPALRLDIFIEILLGNSVNSRPQRSGALQGYILSSLPLRGVLLALE
jgi:hypothetical protein